jgi:hypothetical protein
MASITREWAAYSNEDGEPWAIFVHGHIDLRTIRSIACKKEMKEAFEHSCGDSEDWFHGNLNIGHWWIRDAFAEGDDDANPNCPWHFCEKGDSGAIPITGAKF